MCLLLVLVEWIYYYLVAFCIADNLIFIVVVVIGLLVFEFIVFVF